MRLVLALCGSTLVAASLCTSPGAEPPAEPSPERAGIEKALGLARLACVAYTIERDMGTHKPSVEADEVCRLLLREGSSE